MSAEETKEVKVKGAKTNPQAAEGTARRHAAVVETRARTRITKLADLRHDDDDYEATPVDTTTTTATTTTVPTTTMTNKPLPPLNVHQRKRLYSAVKAAVNGASTERGGLKDYTHEKLADYLAQRYAHNSQSTCGQMLKRGIEKAMEGDDMRARARAIRYSLSFNGLDSNFVFHPDAEDYDAEDYSVDAALSSNTSTTTTTTSNTTNTTNTTTPASTAHKTLNFAAAVGGPLNTPEELAARKTPTGQFAWTLRTAPPEIARILRNLDFVVVGDDSAAQMLGLDPRARVPTLPHTHDNKLPTEALIASNVWAFKVRDMYEDAMSLYNTETGIIRDLLNRCARAACIRCPNFYKLIFRFDHDLDKMVVAGEAARAELRKRQGELTKVYTDKLREFNEKQLWKTGAKRPEKPRFPRADDKSKLVFFDCSKFDADAAISAEDLAATTDANAAKLKNYRISGTTAAVRDALKHVPRPAHVWGDGKADAGVTEDGAAGAKHTNKIFATADVSLTEEETAQMSANSNIALMETRHILCSQGVAPCASRAGSAPPTQWPSRARSRTRAAAPPAASTCASAPGASLQARRSRTSFSTSSRPSAPASSASSPTRSRRRASPCPRSPGRRSASREPPRARRAGRPRCCSPPNQRRQRATPRSRRPALPPPRPPLRQRSKT